jgi:dTDP-4-dehydrorhamnose reductase
MHILVTGANGLVGPRLVRQLSAGRHAVTALVRGPLRVPVDATVQVRVADLTDAGATLAAVREAGPDAIVNCAGLTDVDGCERDPAAAYAINVAAVATLCRAAREFGAHFVQISTDYVFDGEAGPYDVDAVPNPRGAYALTKHLGEQTVRVLCAPGSWTVARVAVVYGWPAAGHPNFGSWLVDALRAGRPVRLFADQWVSPTHVSSAAAMIAEVAERRLGGIWHLAGGEVVDRVEFGRRLCERFGYDPRLIEPTLRQDVALAMPRPRHTGLVVEQTAAMLIARPLSLDEAMNRFHDEAMIREGSMGSCQD